MDITNKSARKVLCIRSDNDTYGAPGDPKHLLKIGNIYQMTRMEVYNYYTSIYIKELDTWFNSVLFSEVTDEYPEAKTEPSVFNNVSHGFSA